MHRRALLGTIATAGLLAAQSRPAVQRKGRIKQGLWTSNFGQTDLPFEQLCAEAARLGHGAVLLVGDPAYYARFGFTAEKTDALAMPGPYEKHRFLALELAVGALEGAAGVLRPAGRKIEATARRLAA